MSNTILKVNIPGLRNSNEEHWQTLFENEDPINFYRVQQHNWEQPDCETWIDEIELSLSKFDHSQLILIGHSIGCIAIIKWFEKYGHHIKGALLAAPSDSEREGYPNYITGFTPIPTTLLPFPSVVVASNNDHVTLLERSEFFAQSWGSKMIILRDAGHIEPKSGFGYWQKGKDIIRELESIS